MKLLRKYVNKALVIFPFEEKFYRDRGVDATFVGHPLGRPAPAITRDDYAKQNGIDASKPWITLMPGSRRKEVRMNLPTILEAADKLGARLRIPIASRPYAGNLHSSKLRLETARPVSPRRHDPPGP